MTVGVGAGHKRGLNDGMLRIRGGVSSTLKSSGICSEREQELEVRDAEGGTRGGEDVRMGPKTGERGRCSGKLRVTRTSDALGRRLKISVRRYYEYVRQQAGQGVYV